MLIISLIILSILAPDFSIIRIYFCCVFSCQSQVLLKDLKNQEFHSWVCGFSWLIFARNADFKRSDFSAFSLAFFKCFCAAYLSVTSEKTNTTPFISPVTFFIGAALSAIWNSVPFFEIKMVWLASPIIMPVF